MFQLHFRRPRKESDVKRDKKKLGSNYRSVIYILYKEAILTDIKSLKKDVCRLPRAENVGESPFLLKIMTP